WLQGGARPVEQQAMQSNGSIDKAAASKLPAVTGTPVFLSDSQNTAAASYLAANWAKAVS
ncbi:MAG TPA: ABC transporter substrate-binding protein, partial [Streptosporangiaceae bacterium]|nr:ABC transporter substrate-binding protein [Streptosporangiaceae bacterium]